MDLVIAVFLGWLGSPSPGVAPDPPRLQAPGELVLRCPASQGTQVVDVVLDAAEASTRLWATVVAAECDPFVELVRVGGRRERDDDSGPAHTPRLAFRLAPGDVRRVTIGWRHGRAGASLRVRVGTQPEAFDESRACGEALARVRAGAEPLRAKLLLLALEAAIEIGDHAWSDARADELGRVLDALDPELRTRACGVLGFARAHRRSFAEAAPWFARASDAAFAVHDLDGASHWVGHLAGSHLYGGELERAAPLFAWALALATESSNWELHATWSGQLARTQILRGEARAAEQTLRLALHAPGDAAVDQRLGWHERLSQLAFLRGDYARALADGRDALELARRGADRQLEARLAGLLAYQLITLGRRDEALDHLDDAFLALDGR